MLPGSVLKLLVGHVLQYKPRAHRPWLGELRTDFLTYAYTWLTPYPHVFVSGFRAPLREADSTNLKLHLQPQTEPQTPQPMEHGPS